MATPPDFVSGAVLEAAQLNKIGLWLIKTQTIGTTQSSVTVTGAFSADYDVYLVTVSGGVASANNAMNLTFGSTATGYYHSGYNMTFSATTVNGTFVSNGSSFASVVYGSTNALSGQILIDNPFNTKRTTVSYQARGSSTNYFVNKQDGFLDDNTSYTAFTLTTSAGTTVTGGTIRVYGYRN